MIGKFSLIDGKSRIVSCSVGGLNGLESASFLRNLKFEKSAGY